MFRPVRSPNPFSLRRVLQSALVVTSFSQSLGSELLTNAGFDTWSSDNPTGWIVSGETASRKITESSPGSGVARIVSDAAATPEMYQQVNTAGVWHEAYINQTAVVAGGTRFAPGTIVFHNIVGYCYQLYRSSVPTYSISSGSTSNDVSLDSASCRRITLNPVWIMPSVDGTHTFTFTLPVSPAALQRIDLRYRQQDDLNYWAAYLRRNAANTAWDFRLDSVNAGAATNRINVAGVGTPDAVRVVTSGNNHTAYTGVSGTYTQRGTQQTNSLHAAQTGITAIYNSPFTPSELRSTPA